MRPRRVLFVAALSAVATVAVVAAANVRGWRALITSRLLRVENEPDVVPAPKGFQPHSPDEFSVSIFARGFKTPRWMAVAPNGDLFVADSAAGEVVVLPARNAPAERAKRRVFAGQLNLPFGIAFHDGYVYIAQTNRLVRFRFDPKTSDRLSGPETVLDLPGKGYHGHWTRSVMFSPDGSRMFVSVGSETNVSVESDARRAAILAALPDGAGVRVYASGLRNPVGLAIEPETGSLWAAVNERDNLGDETPPDYFTRVVDGGFYGWPYSYIGAHVDNRVPSRSDLVARAIVPDVLLSAHAAPIQAVFYTGSQFPERYRGGAFLAEHGSWNRRTRSGYDVVFVPFEHGRPSGTPTRFLSGFVPDPLGRQVYGRPTGVAVLDDGSLAIADDGGGIIWRVTYRASVPAAIGEDSADRRRLPPL